MLDEISSECGAIQRRRRSLIRYILQDCGARLVIGDAVFSGVLTDATHGCPAVRARWAVGGDIDGFEPYAEVIGNHSAKDLEDPVLGNRMLYTSGTTGRPKGVLRPPLYSTGLKGLTDAPRYEAGTGQRNLCTGPLYHGGPLIYSLTMPLSQGTGVVLMERWDAAHALELIEQHRITHTHMVPRDRRVGPSRRLVRLGDRCSGVRSGSPRRQEGIDQC